MFLEGNSDLRCCNEVVVAVLIRLRRDKAVTVCLNEVVVLRDLINSLKHTCTYFKRC